MAVFAKRQGEIERQTDSERQRTDPVFSQEGVSSSSHYHVLITFQCTANRAIVPGQKTQHEGVSVIHYDRSQENTDKQ